MEKLKIGICGAGIGGLAAAVAFAKNGHKVRVFEQADELTEAGAGIQISPNGVAVLKALGCKPALDENSVRADSVQLRDGLSGRRLLTLDFARFAPDLDWRFVHRAQLVDLLFEQARILGVSVETGMSITPPPGGGTLDDDDLLVGADGLHSKIRASMEVRSEPFFTGQVAWRALIRNEGPPVAEVHMSPGRHVVSYPLPNGTRNIVAVEERDAWTEEGWSFTDVPANMRSSFQGFSPRVREWLDQVEHCYIWGLFRHPVAALWSNGRQVILGDAAHPSLPFLAQGANLALEDAWVLSEQVTKRGLEMGLKSYQDLRRPRVVRTVNAANSNARNYHLRGPARTLAHFGLRFAEWFAPNLPLRKFDWLYRHDVTGRS